MDDAGLPDAGRSDAGPSDAGAPDAGPPPISDAGPDPGPRSRITLYLPGGPLSVDALDGDGRGVVVTAGYGDDAGGLFFAAGASLYTFDRARRRLVAPAPIEDATRAAAVAPDLLVAGFLDAPVVLAVREAEGFLLERAPADGGSPRLGPPVALREASSIAGLPPTPFAPPAMALVTLDEVTFLPVALAEARDAFLVESPPGSFVFARALEVIETCDSLTRLTPDLFTRGPVPGGGGAPVTLVLDEGRAYALRSGALCFEEGVPLVDEAVRPITAPTVAFGANFDASADHSPEVLVVVEGP